MPGVQLIVGLGNPGSEYQATRHNLGAEWVAQLVARYSFTLKPNARFFGSHGVLSLDHAACQCLIPTTFMNQSGRAVHAVAHFYKIRTADILIVHDELDLPVGQARFKQGGGSGGHNGLKNIIAYCGQDFWRLRLGIGHPRDQVINYVLSRPPLSEQTKLQHTFDNTFTVFPDFITGHTQEAMHQLHGMIY